jgi:hypothetical protein
VRVAGLSLVVLASCSGLEPPSRLSDTRTAGHVLPSGAGRLPDALTLEAFPTLRRELSRPVSLSLPPLPICDVAQMVIVDALETPLSCTATGTMGFAYAGQSGSDLVNLFASGARSVGVSVALQAGAVLVTGAGTNSTGTATVGFDGQEYRPIIVDASNASFSFGTEPLTMVPLPRHLRGQDVLNVAAQVGISADTVELNRQTYIVTQDRVTLDILLGSLGGAQDASVFVPVSDSYTTQYSALVADLADVHPVPGGVLLRSDPHGLARSVEMLRSVSPVKTDYTVEVVFLSMTTQDALNMSADLGGIHQAAGAVFPGVLLNGLLAVAQEDFQARIISRPSLTTTSVVPTQFQSGLSVPIATLTEQDGRTTRTVDYRDTGISLSVTPSPVGRLVRVSVQFENSAVVSTGTDNPAFSVQRVNTTVEIAPGDVVILTGMRLSQESVDRSLNFIRPFQRRGHAQTDLQIALTVR